jgi:hypothetical protein
MDRSSAIVLITFQRNTDKIYNLVDEFDDKSQKRNLVQNKNKQRQINERNKMLGKY